MSGTYAYAPLIDDFVTDAWERCGKSPTILTGDVARSARRSMQAMLISWTNMGPNLWQVGPTTFNTAPPTTSYPLPAQYIDVFDGILTVGGVNRILGNISRDSYVALPLPKIPGPPTQFWLERVLPATIMHLYPAPDKAYLVTAYCLRQPQDVSALLQAPDAPVLWADAIEAGLASRLATKFVADPQKRLELRQDADAAYAEAARMNRETVPLTISPSEWAVRA